MATSTTEDKNIEVESDIFNCTICLERFRKPKYLPCLHTFCESCLKTYIISTQSGQDTSPSEFFHCPICRQEVKSPYPNSPKEEWAKLMPLNHMIFSLMGSSGTEKCKGETICGPCERGEEISSARIWCFECTEGLCESCSKYHTRAKTSANHKVIAIHDFNTQNLETKIPDIDEPCPKHKGDVLKVYCVEHQTMCCVICLSVTHRKCEDIQTFDDMAEKMKSDGGISHMSKIINDIHSKVETLRVHKQDNIEKIQKQQQVALEQASKLVEQAKEKLEKCHKGFKTQLSQIHKEQNTRLLEAKERLEIFQKTLSNSEKMLKVVSEYGSFKQLFITSEKVKAQLQIQGKELKEYLKDDPDIEYGVEMDKQLMTMVTSLKSIADINLTTKPCDKSISAAIQMLPFTLSPRSEELTVYDQLKSADIADLEAVKVWDMKVNGWCAGGLFLNDGRLLCSDYRCKTLSVYDKHGQLQISHSLDYQPWDVVEDTEGNIMVAGYSINNIKIYSLQQEKFTEIQNIEVKFTPKSINVIKEHILVGSDTDKCIHVMTKEGNTTREIKTSRKYSFIAKLKSPDKESRFYYCDDEDIVCQSLDGKELLRHSLQNASETRGIAMDCGDNIYVCGMDSKTINVISKDGISSRILMSNPEGIVKPFAIGFNKAGTEFFVTGHGNGYVAVYKLCLKK